MGKTKGRGSSSSSSVDSHSTASSFSFLTQRNLNTDLHLSLGGNLSREQMHQSDYWTDDAALSKSTVMEVDESDCVATFYVKVYMDGIPIGRKLDLLANGGFSDLINTINYMFSTAILWSEEDGAQAQGRHVLTYEDKEGDWLMVGDVPWEMLLSSVKRLKITRIC